MFMMKNGRRVIASVLVKQRDVINGQEVTRHVRVDFFSASEWAQHKQLAIAAKIPGLSKLGKVDRHAVVLPQTVSNAVRMAQHDNIVEGAEFRAAFDQLKADNPKLSTRRQARKWLRGAGIVREQHALNLQQKEAA